MKINIKKDENNLITLTFAGMTEGKILALQNALESYNSTLAQEIFYSLKRALDLQAMMYANPPSFTDASYASPTRYAVVDPKRIKNT
jgi:hypothetical protein